MITITKKKLNKLYRIALGVQMRNSGGLAGQGFTSYVCLKCKATNNYPNTNVPIFCDECSKEILMECRREDMKDE